MKRVWALTFIGGAGLLLAHNTPALAYSLPTKDWNPFCIKLADVGEITEWIDDQGTTQTSDDVTHLEQRTLLYVTDIQDTCTGFPCSVGEDPDAGGKLQLTALMYDLEPYAIYDPDTLGSDKVTSISEGFPTTAAAFDALVASGALNGNEVLFYQPLERNPLPQDASTNDGGVFELYSDETPESVTASAPPSAWVEGSTSTRDGFPDFSDGTLALGGVFMNLSDAGALPLAAAAADVDGDLATAVFYANITSPWTATTGTAAAYAMIDVLSGSQRSAVKERCQPGLMGAACDMFVSTTTFTNLGMGDDTSWDVMSQDPVHYIGNPEPASVLVWAIGMAGLGSTGLGLRLRRRLRRTVKSSGKSAA